MADQTVSDYGFSVEPPRIPGSVKAPSSRSPRQDAMLVARGYGLVFVLLLLGVVPAALRALDLGLIALLSSLALYLALALSIFSLGRSFTAAVRRAVAEEDSP